MSEREPAEHGGAEVSDEQAQGRSQSSVLSGLLASARHELRSPLQSIQGFAELLDGAAYGSLNAEQRTFVCHILQGSAELGGMLETCLELLELELGGYPLERERTNLHAELAEALEHAAAARGVVLRLHSETPSLTARAKLDRGALRRALSALVTGMTIGRQPALVAELDVAGDHARLRLFRCEAVPGAALLTTDELAHARRAGRALVWLRLAHALLSRLDGGLLASEQADRAEVRLRLSSTH